MDAEPNDLTDMAFLFQYGTSACGKTTHTQLARSEEMDNGEVIGGLINSDGEECEWDPASYYGKAGVNRVGEQQESAIRGTTVSDNNKNDWQSPGPSRRNKVEVHRIAKPYRCVRCQMPFRFRQNLKKHVRLHLRKKPVLCPSCGRAYACRCRLKRPGGKDFARIQEAEEASVPGAPCLLVTSSGRRSYDSTLTPTGAPCVLVTSSGRRSYDTTSTPTGAPFVLVTSSGRSYDTTSTPRAAVSDVPVAAGSRPAGGPVDSGGPREPQEQPQEQLQEQPPRPPKTHRCSVCDKLFASGSALKRHLVIHSGSKPFTCTVCGRGFTQIGNLKTHQKVHNGEKPTGVTAVVLPHAPSAPEAQPSPSSSAAAFMCRVCWTQFPDHAALEEHTRESHEATRPHECTQCGKRFADLPRLRRHQAGHGGAQPYRCSQCDKGFQTRNGLEVHTRNHTGEKPFSCSVCGKSFKQSAHLKAHQSTHSGARPHLCSICGKSYSRTEELKVHLRVHTGERPYRCDECGKSFYYKQGLNNHRRTHNPKPLGPTKQLGRPKQVGSSRKAYKPRRIPPSSPPPPASHEGMSWDPPSLGNSPNRDFGNQENYASTDHGQEREKWDFASFSLWGQHPDDPADGTNSTAAGHGGSIGAVFGSTVTDSYLARWRPSIMHPLGPPRLYSTSCQDMHGGRTGTTCREEDHHTAQQQNGATSPREESCSETQSVEDSDTLHKPKEPEHQGTSKPKRSHDCLNCGKVFASNTALKRHLVIHSGNRPYRCQLCGRGFTQGGNLKTHMKVHRGERSIEAFISGTSHKPEDPPVPMHVCGECGMDFALKEQLEEHKKFHKKLKPYVCSDCGKSFKNECYFKLHRRGHTEDLPFLCSKCGKRFVTANALQHHEVTHTEEKNYSCGQCGKAFKQSSHLYVHLRMHTGVRPHLCSICGKSYFKAHDLKVHVRVHTGEKPYTCEKCGKCFYYVQGYNQHLKTHDKKPKKPTKPLGRPKRSLMTND